VAAAQPLPLDGGPGNVRWGTAEAQTNPAAFEQADIHPVLPGYFATMQTQFVDGRDFTDAESQTGGNVIIIDELLASKAFPNGNAVGNRLLVRARTQEAEWHEVIGVVRHQRNVTPAANSDEAVFVVDGYFGHGAASRWAIRTSGDPAALSDAVRAELARIDPLIPAAQLQPMSVFVDRAMAPTRFALALISAFAAIAAILAAVGLYGVLSTAVRQRTPEIGVRMVFGAPTTSIFRLVIGHGLLLSFVGLLVGVAAALALTRVLESMLVGVEPTDPLTFVVTGAVFVVIAAVACFVPARRAALLDPAVAIREE
jgi:putative ABC transport system permease protein